MSNIWFTADTHFGHDRIIQYCNRPFKSSEEMDQTIIDRFNEVIRPGDLLYHLGDMSWSGYNLNKFFHTIPTKEVFLIYGNHDDPKRTKHPHIRGYHDIKRISINHGKILIVMCHYAMRTWRNQGQGSYQLYGHSHGRLTDSGLRQMDVGVDTNNFYPYHLDQVIERLKNRPYYADAQA